MELTCRELNDGCYAKVGFLTSHMNSLRNISCCFHPDLSLLLVFEVRKRELSPSWGLKNTMWRFSVSYQSEEGIPAVHLV